LVVVVLAAVVAGGGGVEGRAAGGSGGARDVCERLVEPVRAFLEGTGGQESDVEALSGCLRDHARRGGMLNATRDACPGAIERARAAGAVPLLVDVISQTGGRTCVAAARGLAAMARASTKVRDEAEQAGAVRELIQALRAGTKALGTPSEAEEGGRAGAAAEALSALVFAHKGNHGEAVRRGGPSLLLALSSAPGVARGRALAALGALLEDYCASSTGGCPFVAIHYQARGLDPDRRGHSDVNAPLLVDASALRLAMIPQGVVAALAEAVRQGAVAPPPPGGACPPPSDAFARSGGVAVGAAIAIRALALSHVLHKPLVEAGVIPHLANLRDSKCEVERHWAKAAMLRLLAVGATREAFNDKDRLALDPPPREEL